MFGGPTMNLGKAVDTKVVYSASTGESSWSFTEEGLKARFGATVGLGLGYDINEKWGINLEGRVGVTPSIFGAASDCRKAEATARLNLGVAYTFGGKKFAPLAAKVDEEALNNEINKYRSELAAAQTDLADAKINGQSSCSSLASKSINNSRISSTTSSGLASGLSILFTQTIT